MKYISFNTKRSCSNPQCQTTALRVHYMCSHLHPVDLQGPSFLLVWARDSALLQNIQTSNGVEPVGPKGTLSLGIKCLELAAQQTTELNPRPAHTGFMVDKVSGGKLSLQVLCFTPPLSLHQSSTLSHSKYHCNLQLKLSLNTHLHI